MIDAYVEEICFHIIYGNNHFSLHMIALMRYYEWSLITPKKVGVSCESGYIYTLEGENRPNNNWLCAHNNNLFLCIVHEFEILDIHKKAIMESRGMSFFDHIFPCRSIGESSFVKRTLDTTNESSGDQEEVVDVDPRRSKMG